MVSGDHDLAQLAAARGVATTYDDADGHRVDVEPDVVRAILGVLGTDAGTAQAVRRELRDARQRPGPATRTLVAHPGERWRLGETDATAEDGSVHRLVDDIALPPGWYRVTVDGRDATLAVPPRRLGTPPRTWGWTLQLYALRSANSWGAGDLGDLRSFAQWAGRVGDAGLVLLNPLHAGATEPRAQPSPYSPSSRRFLNAAYLRVADTEAYRRADAGLRARVDALRPDNGPGLIDHDVVWRAKRQALELLFPFAEPAGLDLDSDPDPDLRDFATFCALAERHGSDWRAWPDPLRRPASAAVATARQTLAPRVAFYAWSQRLCREQLRLAQAAARAAGMPIGLVHDLAVGVDPGGADGWMLQDALITGATIGAPPDTFNRRGQDWSLTAWRPDGLAEHGYAPYREMLRAVLSHGGGLRVDHVAGLWRLWWVPAGAPPDRGTYVSYDAAAMLAGLTIEAHRAGAVIVGEDLGTVQPEVTAALAERDMLGSAVMWLTRDEAADRRAFRPPSGWPPEAAASISTHDLPTAAGMLAGEHLRVRAELGIPVRAGEWDAADRQRLIDLLRREGLAEPAATDRDLVLDLHRLLATAPCRLLLASPYDAVGEIRQPNLPGTVNEYPNWRMPMGMTLEELCEDPRMHAVARLFGQARQRSAPETPQRSAPETPQRSAPETLT